MGLRCNLSGVYKTIKAKYNNLKSPGVESCEIKNSLLALSAVPKKGSEHFKVQNDIKKAWLLHDKDWMNANVVIALNFCCFSNQLQLI